MNLSLVLIASVLSFAAFSDAGGIAVNVHRIESTRSRLIRTGKWSAYQDLKTAIRSARAASSKSQPLIDYDDGEYIANVIIGTPPQRFLVLLSFDTGAFWVPDKTCPSSKCPPHCKDVVYCKSLCDPRCCSAKSVARLTPAELVKMEDCGWRNRFDSAKSSSYKKNGTHFTAVVAPGADADGFIGIDTVTLGDTNGLTVHSQTFGQATSALFDATDAYDGVLGVGQALLGLPGITPLLYNAKQQGVIQRNVVTLALIREGIRSPDLPGGTITYGDVDIKNCGQTVTYIQAMDNDPSVLSLDGVSFGGFEAPRPAGDVWRADFGFENTVLSGPMNVTDGLAKVAGAQKDGYGNYNIACNATVPSLFLTLSGQRFEIPGAELIRASDARDPSNCIFNVFGEDMIPGIFVVGAALARNYCLVFDYDDALLGFSRNLYSAPASG
ncbi:aspartic protease 2B [Aphelenchoides avenae]|nr:aspartic protease 2B [Aphelenchus avenae]